MRKPKPSFDEILDLARRGTDDGDLSAAPGFATRVAALWAHGPLDPGWLALWERAVSWGAAVTVTACLLTALFCRDDFNAASRAADTFAAFGGLDNDGPGAF